MEKYYKKQFFKKNVVQKDITRKGYIINRTNAKVRSKDEKNYILI